MAGVSRLSSGMRVCLRAYAAPQAGGSPVAVRAAAAGAAAGSTRPAGAPLQLARAARRGQRVVYTTPLKALSNQKLFELRARFGAERVGLQTGDVSVAIDADVVVMTTEVLRNIMFRVGDAATGARAGLWCQDCMSQ